MRPLPRSTNSDRYSSRVNVTAGFDVDAMHRAPHWAGLLGHQSVTEHRLGGGTHFLEGAGEADTAFAVRIIGETAGTAAAGVDLGLHHVDRAGEFVGGGHRFVRGPRDIAVGHGNTVALQQVFGLVLVDVHGRRPLPNPPPLRGRGRC